MNRTGLAKRSRPRWRLAALGAALVAAGSLLAWAVQTAGGVEVREVRFPGAGGVTMSGLLYTPPNATPATPAPGVLAVHGYINTRETQDAFAIEFARRGYVVLAMDQRGHGYSGGAAMTEGFGGPDGLTYLRSLPIVDKTQIGLEGHSMGGWTVLAAAKAMPDGYRSMVLEGSSTGPPFAPDGSVDWPRNLSVVFSRFDEFGPLMWGVQRSAEVTASPKLKALFGVTEDVVPGRLYGDPAAGTARILQIPNTTHPGDHFSRQAVGHAIDWFAATLEGGKPLPSNDQIWLWKELGNLIGLVGMLILVLGVFELWLAAPVFAALRGAPAQPQPAAGPSWWALVLIGAFAPPFTFMVLPLVGNSLVPLSPVFPQAITNHMMVWALGNAAFVLGLGFLLGRRKDEHARKPQPLLAMLIAAATLAVVYAVAVVVGRLLLVDFRFWIVALKPMSAGQAAAFAAYVIPFTLFVAAAFRGVEGLMARSPRAWGRYGFAVAALAGGFVVVVGAIYGLLFVLGGLPAWVPPLNAIVAIQFIPVLAALAVIMVFTWRRTGSYLPGGLLSGPLVTWYVTAGTATHFAG